MYLGPRGAARGRKGSPGAAKGVRGLQRRQGPQGAARGHQEWPGAAKGRQEAPGTNRKPPRGRKGPPGPPSASGRPPGVAERIRKRGRRIIGS